MVEKQLKDRIIETALTLFEKYGYHGVTVDRIVAECGASKGGFIIILSRKMNCFTIFMMCLLRMC